MTSDYTVRIKKYDATDPRLGRHVRHDSRSLLYRADESDLSTLQSVRHASLIPTLDQGQLGSCTGNAGTKCLTYVPVWVQALMAQWLGQDGDTDESFAVALYSAATQIDSYDGSYPPDDTGCDGLSIAKVLKTRGLISGYTHATSLNAVLTALQTQAVIVGTEWHQGQYDPDSTGRLSIGGSVEGGHEYVLDEIDVTYQRVWMQNSWGDEWGTGGRAFYSWDDFATLLAADGDCTIFTPQTQPAPTPTTPLDAITEQMRVWAALPHSSKVNVLLQRQIQVYLATL